MHLSVHCSTIYNSQDMDTNVHQQNDKEDETHTFNGICSVTKKNRILTFAEMWIDLETVIQSEVSQKEKSKYHIISLICEI